MNSSLIYKGKICYVLTYPKMRMASLHSLHLISLPSQGRPAARASKGNTEESIVWVEVEVEVEVEV